MEPLHFGPSEQPLFGIYQPPGSGLSRDAWLICNPLGQEAIRTYRLSREIALRLGAAGSHVLRFDYTGCGDSGGSEEDYSVEQWIADIRAAATELTEISGFDRIHMFGIRLGATLAMLAANVPQLSGRIVAVDPILDGKKYLEKMRKTHARMCIDTDRFGIRRDVGEAPDDLLGFRLKQKFLIELEGIKLQPDTLPSKISAHILDSDTAADEQRHFCDALLANEVRSSARLEADFSPNWSDASHLERTLMEPGLAAEVCRLAKL